MTFPIFNFSWTMHGLSRAVELCFQVDDYKVLHTSRTQREQHGISLAKLIEKTRHSLLRQRRRIPFVWTLADRSSTGASRLWERHEVARLTEMLCSTRVNCFLLEPLRSARINTRSDEIYAVNDRCVFPYWECCGALALDLTPINGDIQRLLGSLKPYRDGHSDFQYVFNINSHGKL